MNAINQLGIRASVAAAVVVIVLFSAVKGVQRVFFSESDNAVNGTSSRSLSQNNGQERYFDDSEFLDPYERFPATDPQVLSSLTTGSGVTVTDTYTSKYLSTLPDDASSEEILNLQELELFVDRQRGVLLPDVEESSLVITNDAGKDTIQTYLQAISSLHNEDITQITSEDIERAYRALTNTGNATDFEIILSQLEKNISVIKNVPAPQEAKNVHKHLVAASMSLLENATLLRNAPMDFVGSLVGAKNIEELGIEFDKITSQVRALEEKYNLE